MKKPPHRLIASLLALGLLLSACAHDPTSATPDREASIDAASRQANPPAYPMASFRAGVGGTVWLRIQVDADGQVEHIEIDESSGHGGLDRAARLAAERWTYLPAMRNGEPVPGSLRTSLRFEP